MLLHSPQRSPYTAYVGCVARGTSEGFLSIGTKHRLAVHSFPLLPTILKSRQGLSTQGQHIIDKRCRQCFTS